MGLSLKNHLLDKHKNTQYYPVIDENHGDISA